MIERFYGPAIRLRTRLAGDPFAGIAPDPARRARQMARPPARLTYAIFFTPRSGSSRVTDILGRTGVLGRPSEFFNPTALPALARNCNAGSLDDLVRLLPRIRRAPEVFGFEIAYPHILAAFGGEARFRAAFPDLTAFWLIREDIVAQAVSASRMVQTGLGHLETPSPDRAAAADRGFRYRPGELRARIRRLIWAEARTEGYFARHGILPVRLSYERLLPLTPQAIAARFAEALGVDLDPKTPLETGHARVSTGRSVDYARRFRDSHAAWLTRIEARRAPLIAALTAGEPRCPLSP